jgi:hypothetical protein
VPEDKYLLRAVIMKIEESLERKVYTKAIIIG